jgi:tetratricopeptide (TPR) repeat protein
MDLESMVSEKFRSPALIVGVVIVLLGITGAVVANTSIQDSRMASANDMLFQARKSLETEQKALVETATPSAAPSPGTSGAKAPKATADAADTAGIEFKKVDVAAKFPESLKKFQAVIDSYPSTRAAFEARFAVGSLYFDHGDAVHAQEWFQKASDNAPNSADRAFALQSVGYSLENQGKKTDAIQIYKKALEQNNGELKADLDASIARCAGTPPPPADAEKSQLE